MYYSKIDNLTKDELQVVFNTSNSWHELFIKIGFTSSSGHKKTLMKRINDKNIDLIIFNKNCESYKIEKMKEIRKNGKTKTLNESDYLVENCKHDRVSVKKFILDHNILEYTCDKCKNGGIWMEEALTLQLEHKNGIYNDNRIENLCFLCPNCHSQTPTWGGRNNKKQYKCEKCNSLIFSNKFKLCKKCAGNIRKKFHITKEELQQLVNSMPITKVGEKLGVTDNSIRKRCISLNIDIPKFPIGHWLKHK